MAAACALLLATASLGAAQTIAFDTVLVDAGASGDDKAVADLDLDGYADGILAGAQLRWWRSTGPTRTLQGPFTLDTSTEEFTTDMAAGDLDGDGDPDLVVGDGDDPGNVQWFENPRLSPPDGKGSDPKVGANWTEHAIGSHGSWAHDIEVADLDADGRLDAITCGNGAFKIFFRNSNGTWAARDFAAHADDGSPAAANVDGDGDLDLFVAGGWIEQPAADRRNPAAWSFHPITGSNPGDGPAALALDVDRDGKPDLVTSPQHSAGDLIWFENPADPESAGWPAHPISDAAGSHHLRAADFDADGRLDLLAGLELGAITVWRIAGSGPSFTPFPVDDTGGHNAAVGDFDGDGRPEIWAADYIGHPPLRLHWNASCGIFCDGFEVNGTGRWTLVAP
jgi:hypothetical protein